jgi:hypothetical protein
MESIRVWSTMGYWQIERVSECDRPGFTDKWRVSECDRPGFTDKWRVSECDRTGVTDKWRVSECDRTGFTDDIIDHIYNKHELTIKHVKIPVGWIAIPVFGRHISISWYSKTRQIAKIQGASILLCPTHYCVQLFTVSGKIPVHTFNIHLFNFPLSACCSCIMLHSA